MKVGRHEMIRASAGAGKTYALTQRFVGLLAAGAAPERIVALTFTRKAAGEFFDQILAKLAGAAVDSARARKLAQEIGVPGLGAADFLRLLRTMVDAMPRLNLGTIDGFFARVVRSFPFELGLDGEFRIMEDAPARRERRRVLRRMFTAAGRPDAAQREFIEAFKRATFGLEEKQLARLLDAFLSEHAETFLDAPQAGQWGNPAAIWPDGCSWLDAAGGREAAAQMFQTVLAAEELGEKQRARLEQFLAALPDWLPGAPLPKPVEYLLRNAFASWPNLEEITLERRKVSLSPEARTALRALVGAIAGAELDRRLEMTRGLFAVLQGYERNYHDAVRRAGRLTFADVLRLLLPGAGAPLLTGGGPGRDPEMARLAIDWRLDTRFDHWLLDEFQDTSFAQWSVLRNLIDEVVQDPEQRRSFFYVGDVKQSIFGWRGGDPELFHEIFSHYNAVAPGTIAEGRLDASWRSGPAVIAMVNAVFGNAGVVDELVPSASAERWNKEWREHTSARAGLEGRAELRTAPDEPGRFAETLRLLVEIDPLARGLEAVILVRTNDTASAMAEYLRREGGLAAVAESDRPVATDNPLTAALLALLRVAAHPADTMAREHLAMTPLAALMAEAGLAEPDALAESVLGSIHAMGFAGTIELWLNRLVPVLAGDPFSLGRGRTLAAAAADFDASGSRDVAEFLEFAENLAKRESDTAGAIRVMTVHKAKGLGFDLVILPDLEGQTLADRRRGLAVSKAEDRSIEWVLKMPDRIFVERDPVLAAQLAAEQASAAYENLCVLYVAMTRAKRAMYVITEPVPANSTSRNFPMLLQKALGAGWSQGPERWFASLSAEPAPPAPTPEAEPALPALVRRRVRHPAVAPSAAEAGVLAGAQLFDLERGSAAEFGHEVHELFSLVEWNEPGTWERLARTWKDCGAAADEVLACLRAPDLEELWARQPRVELWRERAFEVLIGESWVTGIFDRVTIERDPAGRATAARVFDFKTDRVETRQEVAAAVARHAAQMNLYRRVVALLAGLGEGQVVCELVFTRRRKREVVAAR